MSEMKSLAGEVLTVVEVQITMQLFLAIKKSSAQVLQNYRGGHRAAAVVALWGVLDPQTMRTYRKWCAHGAGCGGRQN